MIGGYMMDSYGTVAEMGLAGMVVAGLLWIVVIALAAWSLAYLLRTRQQRMQPVAVEIQKRRRMRRDQSW